MRLRMMAAVLVLGTVAYAQRPSSPPKGGGMGGGASAGHGNSDMHAGSSMGRSDMGTMHSDSAGKRSPGELLSQNQKLSSNLEKSLPPGMSAQQACDGFKNLGDCVSAIHVSKNLGISFDEIRTRTTGPDAESLGKVVHQLKPDVDAKAEVKKAKKQAEKEMKDNS